MDADNASGRSPAASTDWRVGDLDSMSARATVDPNLDAGDTTFGAFPTAKLLVSFLRLWESPIQGLGPTGDKP